jgi:hypothetical protein
MERYLGIIKLFNIVAAVVIVLGVVALVWLMVERGRGDRAAVDSGSIVLPTGFRVIEMSATSDFVFLLLGDDDDALLLLRLDPHDPASSASFVVETARP